MLTLVLSKYCYRFLIDGHLLFGPEWSPEEPINYPELVMYCIDNSVIARSNSKIRFVRTF